jgi:quercetin dioxygenase-like cupin family protein
MITIGKTSELETRHYGDDETVRGVEKRVVIGPTIGATGFVMRHFQVAPGGHSPFHQHPWEHEVYVLAGQGTVRTATGDLSIEPGSYVFVPPMDEHQFANVGPEPLEFLCVVPPQGDDG